MTMIVFGAIVDISWNGSRRASIVYSWRGSKLKPQYFIKIPSRSYSLLAHAARARPGISRPDPGNEYCMFADLFVVSDMFCSDVVPNIS